MGFLLAFYSNHMPETHQFCSRCMGQTDEWTDRWTDCGIV